MRGPERCLVKFFGTLDQTKARPKLRMQRVGVVANYLEPFGVAPFTIGASASSGLTVSFRSNTPAVCTVSGATVTEVAFGACSITASQPGNLTYAAATPVTQTFAFSGPCDADLDGVYSVSDVQLFINAALGVPPKVNDLNADGVVNVVDIQIVINAALNLGCTAKLFVRLGAIVASYCDTLTVVCCLSSADEPPTTMRVVPRSTLSGIATVRVSFGFSETRWNPRNCFNSAR